MNVRLGLTNPELFRDGDPPRHIHTNSGTIWIHEEIISKEMGKSFTLYSSTPTRITPQFHSNLNCTQTLNAPLFLMHPNPKWTSTVIAPKPLFHPDQRCENWCTAVQLFLVRHKSSRVVKWIAKIANCDCGKDKISQWIQFSRKYKTTQFDFKKVTIAKVAKVIIMKIFFEKLVNRNWFLDFK